MKATIDLIKKLPGVVEVRASGNIVVTIFAEQKAVSVFPEQKPISAVEAFGKKNLQAWEDEPDSFQEPRIMKKYANIKYKNKECRVLHGCQKTVTFLFDNKLTTVPREEVSAINNFKKH